MKTSSGRRSDTTLASCWDDFFEVLATQTGKMTDPGTVRKNVIFRTNFFRDFCGSEQIVEGWGRSRQRSAECGCPDLGEEWE